MTYNPAGHKKPFWTRKRRIFALLGFVIATLALLAFIFPRGSWLGFVSSFDPGRHVRVNIMRTQTLPTQHTGINFLTDTRSYDSFTLSPAQAEMIAHFLSETWYRRVRRSMFSGNLSKDDLPIYSFHFHSQEVIFGINHFGYLVQSFTEGNTAFKILRSD